MKAENEGTLRQLIGDIFRPLDPVDVKRMKRFVVAKRFAVGCRGEVPIRSVGGNFEEAFFYSNAVEVNVPARKLRVQELDRSNGDTSIRWALGADKAIIYVCYFWQYLKTADRKEAHLTSCKDPQDILWAINAIWCEVGWRIGAYPPHCTEIRRVGYRVVSLW